MKTFNDYLKVYRKQIKKGDIQTAYRMLMEYMMELKNHFKNNFPDYSVSGNLYSGYLDMTFFSIVPSSLKEKKLKFVVVLNHSKVSFEIWLSGVNQQIQEYYWMLFKNNEMEKYRIPENIKGRDSIIEHDLVIRPDFDNLNKLTEQIVGGTVNFINDIENHLTGYHHQKR